MTSRKKWHDISGATRKKETSRRKEMRETKGGSASPDDLKTWEGFVSTINYL